MKDFTKEWAKEELLNLDKERIFGQPKFLLQVLIAYLNYIQEMDIKDLKDYKRIKKEITKDICLIDVDEKKAEVWRNMKK